MDVNITKEFKNTINYVISHSKSKRTDEVLRELIEQSYVDDEFGHLIWPEQEQYNEEADALVIDAVETEIKNQLLARINE